MRAVPLTQIEPTITGPSVSRSIDALGRGHYDLAMFTSDNAVRCFVDALVRRGLEPACLRGVRLAAIGPATAKGLERVGLLAEVVAERFVAEGLVDAVLALSPRPRRVLFPRAAVAREVLPDALRAHRIEVDVVPVYRTIEAPPSSKRELLDALPSCDAMLLTASSTVTELARCLDDSGRERLSEVVIASIGPVTTRAAEHEGLEVAVTASKSTLPSLIEALERHFASAS